MNTDEAWKIVRKYTNASEYSKFEIPIIEEALTHIYVEARDVYEASGFIMGEFEVEVSSYNLAAYYEKIGKNELAIKYYTISYEHGCDFAQEQIDNIIKILFQYAAIYLEYTMYP